MGSEGGLWRGKFETSVSRQEKVKRKKTRESLADWAEKNHPPS